MTLKNKPFKTAIASNTFYAKYAFSPNDTWLNLSIRLVDDVCGTRKGTEHALMSQEDRDQLTAYINDMKFIPAGRYLYYAGRPFKAYNNCFALKGLEDTREEWARLSGKAMSFLTTGGGIGIDYSIFRPKGRSLSRTGGLSSGAVPLMKAINEIGRNVMQGGSRRSAIYGSLIWKHEDIEELMFAKDWDTEIVKGVSLREAKEYDFNFPAPLDMTNISINYDDKWLSDRNRANNEIFLTNVKQALKTGEPGFSFNFGDKQEETLRNACAEFTSSDDSDVCNLGSVNLARIETLEELKDVVFLASKFLVCGTLRAEVPDEDVKRTREKNRRIGLGLMGIHEYLLKNNLPYEVGEELEAVLKIYKEYSEKGANELCDRFYINRPKAYRAIAPTGSIGILASTTTGIEPLYAVAYKRRYLKNGTEWHYEYVVDPIANDMIMKYAMNPESIDTALSLAQTPEKRIKFQADVQKYVDMAISSTINLPAWGTEFNNESTVKPFAEMLAKYAPNLRGFTCYPDGSRGGQPLTVVSYKEAMENKGMVFKEHDVCSLTGHGGSCGA